MTEQAKRLKEELRCLSIDDRLELAHFLWESVGPPPGKVYETEEEFIVELNRRAEEHERDPSTGQPFREAIEELRQEALAEKNAS